MTWKALVLLIGLLSAGCSLTPIVLTEPPPSEPKDVKNGNAEIVVVRPGAFVAGLVSFGVYINDLHVGELGLTDYVHHEVEPGMVKMFAGSEARSTAQFPVEADRLYFLEAVPKMGWWFARVQLQLYENPADGRQAMVKCDDATFDEPRPFPFELNP